MSIKLFKEQQEAVDKAKDKTYFALFMKPGTGKTYTALQIMNEWDTNNILVICPKSVIAEWENSISTYGSKQNFTIVNPQKYVRNIKGYTGYDTIILDEAHGMKSPASKIFKAVTTMDLKYRLILTGTPTDGKAHELLSVSNLLSPTIIGSYWSRLKSDFKLGDYNEIMYAYPGTYDTYIRLFEPYMYTLDKLSEVTLPKLEINHIRLKMGENQRSIYDLMDKYTYINHKGKKKSVHSSAVKVGKLRSVMSGFYRDEFDAKRVFTSVKESKLRSILKGRSEPTIVFTTFTHEENKIIEICEELNKTYRVLSGTSNNTPEYIDEIKEFNYDVLIVNYKSGGAGLNLVKCNYIIQYSLPLSYIDYDQSIKRIWRPGQVNDCKVDIFTCVKSYDDRIITSINNKSEIVNKLLQYRR